MESLIGRWDLTPEQRYWMLTEVGDGCWMWKGGSSTSKGGKRYPTFGVDGKDTRVHRWAYEHFIGPFDPELTIDHLCGQTMCVRPDHLDPKTVGDNVRAHWRDQRGACRNGHPMTEENTVWRSRGTVRKCRTCERALRRRYRAKVASERPPKTPPTECRRGHPMSGDNLVVLSSGKRVCRECRTRRKAEFRARRQSL